MKRGLVDKVCAALGCAMATVLVIGSIQGVSGFGEKEAVIEPVVVYAENYNAGGKTQNTGNVEKKQDSNKIAIVNLDEGVMSDGKKIVYANEIISIPESGDLEVTSLSAAQTGLNSGKYGAYIVIPETFSRTVISINGTPEKCKLSYAINRNATAGSQYKIVHKVLQFIDGLNDDLSYIYLENILSEYHSAQDTAGTVMENDLKDKEAIDQIKASDLVALVQVPALETVQNDVKTLDIGTFSEQNANIVTEIGNAYSTSITDAQTQLTGLREDGTTLQGTLTTNAQNADSTLEELQNVDISRTMEEARSSIEASAASDRESTGELIKDVEKTETTVDSLVDSISNAVAKSNENAKKSTRQEIKGIIERVINEIPDVSNLTVSANETGSVYTISFDGEGIQTDGDDTVEDVPVISLSLADADEDEVEKIQNNSLLMMNISTRLATAYESQVSKTLYQQPVTVAVDLYEIVYPEAGPIEPEVTTDGEETSETGEPEYVDVQPTYIHYDEVNGTQDITYDEYESVHDIFDSLDSDGIIREELDKAGYSTCREFMEAVSKGEVQFSATKKIQLDSTEEDIKAFNTALNEAHKASISGKFSEEAIKGMADRANLPDVSAYKYNEENEIIRDENNVPETLYGSAGNSIKESLTNAKTALQNGLDSRTIGIYSAETGAINGTLTAVETAVDGLNEKVETTRREVSENYTGSNAAITEYETKLGTFAPVLDNTSVSENVSKMNENYSALQQEVFANNQSYQEYANRVYEATDNNINTLKQNISDAQSASEDAVTDGVNNAKSVKSTTSAENQRLLAEFTQQLAYTRLGTLENTTTYEFIANPIEYQDTSPEAKISNNEDYATPTQSAGQNVVANSIGGGSLPGRSSSIGGSTTASNNDAVVAAATTSSDSNADVLPFILFGAAAVALAAFFGIRHYTQKNERY